MKQAPMHLSPEARRWWRAVVTEYELEPHKLNLLTLAATAWDRSEQARLILAKEGIIAPDRYGAPRAHPAVAIERDSRLAFARLVRELALEDDYAPDPRPPRIGGR